MSTTPHRKKLLALDRRNGRRPAPPFWWQFTVRCPHCCAVTVHDVQHCGQYRVCAVCSLCGWHKRIGVRMPGGHR